MRRSHHSCQRLDQPKLFFSFLVSLIEPLTLEYHWLMEELLTSNSRCLDCSLKYKSSEKIDIFQY